MYCKHCENWSHSPDECARYYSLWHDDIWRQTFAFEFLDRDRNIRRPPDPQSNSSHSLLCSEIFVSHAFDILATIRVASNSFSCYANPKWWPFDRWWPPRFYRRTHSSSTLCRCSARTCRHIPFRVCPTAWRFCPNYRSECRLLWPHIQRIWWHCHACPKSIRFVYSDRSVSVCCPGQRWPCEPDPVSKIDWILSDYFYFFFFFTWKAMSRTGASWAYFCRIVLLLVSYRRT